MTSQSCFFFEGFPRLIFLISYFEHLSCLGGHMQCCVVQPASGLQPGLNICQLNAMMMYQQWF